MVYSLWMHAIQWFCKTSIVFVEVTLPTLFVGVDVAT
jgi:hypothetical protein